MNELTMKCFFTGFVLMLGFNIYAQNMSAEPIAGKNTTRKVIQNHLVYPESALAAKKNGKVTVYLDVDKDGIASNYTVRECFDEECCAEAIRLVKQILWIPAKKDGIPIPSKHEYTVEFSAKAYNKMYSKSPKIKVPLDDYKVKNDNKVYELEDLTTAPHPYFSNPNATLNGYFLSEMRYPEQAKELEISGTVILSFTIETDGTVANITVDKSVGGGCDNEAIRLVQDLLWIPGMIDDSLVRTKYQQEITFQFGERNYHDGNTY